MKTIYLCLLILITLFTLTCTTSVAATSVAATSVETSSPKTLPYQIRIKASLALAEALQNSTNILLSTGFVAFDVLNQQLGVKQIVRVFPEAGKYETAHRSFGLHQWFTVTFDSSSTFILSSVLLQYQQTEGVEVAEPIYQRKLDVITPADADFSDPGLTSQWHYQNTGQTGGTPEADIHLPDAWSVTTGSDNVIVAVIDGGLEPTHPDLAGAMWVNTAEANGLPSVDDDQNGYVDDVHGYGFGDNRGDFYAHFHGVHVGGTVGAVSNNSIGVAGVAGGSGQADGVRLMSCAVFGRDAQGGFLPAFVYAADNGAVIAQNSWGGGGPSRALESAIDYFIARAGYDNTEENFAKNLQTGPMAGGIVLFSAGNDNSGEKAYPGAYEPCLAVAATDHHDRKSSFSNYGDWVDIAAPGSSILSTLDNNQYGYLSGTSMACPHVSGVAALLISHLAGPNLTPEVIKYRLLNATDDISAVNSEYAGMLGTGRLNAFRTLRLNKDLPPGAVTDLTVDSLTYREAVLRWTAPGSDGQTGVATRYELRYSTTPLTNDNFSQATLVSGLSSPSPAGTTERAEIVDLPAATQIYFALLTYDTHEQASELSNVASATLPSPPSILLGANELTLKLDSGATQQEALKITNISQESPLTFRLAIANSPSTSSTSASAWLSFTPEKDTLATEEHTNVAITLNTQRLNAGDYLADLTIASNDPDNPSLSVSVRLTVLSNEAISNAPPVLIDTLTDRVYTLQPDAYAINLASFFEDPEGRPLRYAVNVQDSTIITTEILGSVLSVATRQEGETALSVQATDSEGLSLTYTIVVSVAHSSSPVLSTDPLLTNATLQGSPNPMKALTSITYQLTQRTPVSIRVYEAGGRLSTTLVKAVQPAGFHQMQWNTQDLSPGVYVVQLTTTQGSRSIRLIK